MNSAKLTKRYVESISPLPEKDFLVWDREVKGLGLRVFPSGRRTYFVQYRNTNSRTRRQKIGVHGIITAEQAREQAKKILGEVLSGSDPSENRKAAKRSPSFCEFALEYLNVHAAPHKKASSYKEDKRVIENVLVPTFGNRCITEISNRDIQTLHNSFHSRPYSANRMLSLLSSIFNLAMEWGICSDNPSKNIKKYQEHKRTRWLSERELENLWLVLDQYHNQVVALALKLLILTGSRKSEVLSATWDQFDLEKGVWVKPFSSTKQKREEYLPLSLSAQALLKNWRSKSKELYLFPGRISGQPIQDIKGAWATIRKKAGLEDVRIHDLRHTYASHLVSSGLSLSIVGKLLGHTQASTTQRYAHLADEPLREATEMFGRKIGRVSK